MASSFPLGPRERSPSIHGRKGDKCQKPTVLLLELAGRGPRPILGSRPPRPCCWNCPCSSGSRASTHAVPFAMPFMTQLSKGDRTVILPILWTSKLRTRKNKASCLRACGRSVPALGFEPRSEGLLNLCSFPEFLALDCMLTAFLLRSSTFL